MKNKKSSNKSYVVEGQEKDILIRRIVDKLINFNARSYIEGQEYLHSAKKAFNNKEKNKYDYVDFDFKKEQQEKIYKKIAISKRELRELLKQIELKDIQQIYDDAIKEKYDILSTNLQRTWKNGEAITEEVKHNLYAQIRSALGLKDNREPTYRQDYLNYYSKWFEGKY